MKFFKGGKHSVNPRLVEDQREAQQRLSKKALLATNPTQVNLNEKKEKKIFYLVFVG